MLGRNDEDLPLDFWLNTAENIRKFASEKVSLMLWGGEPLLYKNIVPLVKELKKRDFRLTIVTNGTLIDQYPDLLSEYIDTVHISVDGGRELHNQVRGEGVFEKLEKNLKYLENRKGKLIFLTTISDANVKEMAQLPHKLAKLSPDGIVLQPLMYLNSKEIEEYQELSRKYFKCEYAGLQSWHREDDGEYLKELFRQIELVKRENYSVPVNFTPHKYHVEQAETPHCEAPFNRIHVQYDGEVGFCTDYFGFSAGNLLKNSLEEIFFGEKVQTYRRMISDDKLPICRHCPWRLQKLIR